MYTGSLCMITCILKKLKYMADKIATKQFCNSLKSGAFTTDLTKMPTKLEIVTAGLTVVGTYVNNQLVCEKDISSPSKIFFTGGLGNVFYKDIPI